jgi:hypothetical protein
MEIFENEWMKLLAEMARLSETEDSDHFKVHFLWRNPPGKTAGPGHSDRGVRGMRLVAHYVAALESLYQTLGSPPFNWKPPIHQHTIYST